MLVFHGKACFSPYPSGKPLAIPQVLTQAFPPRGYPGRWILILFPRVSSVFTNHSSEAVSGQHICMGYPPSQRWGRLANMRELSKAQGSIILHPVWLCHKVMGMGSGDDLGQVT